MTHLNAQEYVVLSALARLSSPLTAKQIEPFVGEAAALSIETIDTVCNGLKSHFLCNCPVYVDGLAAWQITERGRQAVSARAAEIANTTPFSYVLREQEEETDPPTALLCVDEDELDTWWESLDVAQKADCFTQFALTQYTGERCHAYIEDKSVRIPVTGTIGDPLPGDEVRD